MNTPVTSEIKQILFDKGWRYKLGTEGDKVINSLAEQRWNEGNLTYVDITIGEVVMWLYKTHGIWISVSPVFEFNDGREDYLTLQGYQYYIIVITDNRYNQEKTYADRGHKNTPTEAYEAAIEYTLINLIK